ncbi:hypothetical protein NDO75_05005 [Natrinema sp. 1APR25-10V2]|nr:hypothetical protein [Natrinema sp. 1APR25-10V2]
MGYHVNTTAEMVDAAFEHAEPRDDGGYRDEYEIHLDSLCGILAEQAVCAALDGVREPHD